VKHFSKQLGEWGADTAVVLGSGLSTIVPDEGLVAISYSEFDEIPQPSVPGHEGRFMLGVIGGARVIFAQGRVHLYEGHNARQVTSVVRALANGGVKNLILTNAAGSANSEFAPGTWMMLQDHLNLTGATPLLGGPNFIDMSAVYSEHLRELFRATARKEGIVLHEGVYAGLLGPQYETPAEVRMLQKLGADAIGMSTVLEAIQARALGMNVAGFSCLTNLAAGLSLTGLSHAEVLDTGSRAAADFGRLLFAALPEISKRRPTE
jgi:purine-nucleoside phosphorylase